jgi:hypothetical protein
MIGAAFGTGTAQAVVASLVEVVNPNTSPVPTSVVNPGTSPVLNSSVDDPGRIAYQSQVSNSSCGTAVCDLIFPTVPSGHRVVVQHIVEEFVYTSEPTNIIVTAFNESTIPAFFLTPSTLNESLVDQPALFYVDAGQFITLSIVVQGSMISQNGLTPHATFIGYELDCTVAACAPIATQWSAKRPETLAASGTYWSALAGVLDHARPGHIQGQARWWP